MKWSHYFFDCGSAATRVMVSGVMVWHQPTILAWHQDRQAVVAVGDEAYRLAGKTPQSITIINPIQNGVVGDVPMAAAFIESIAARFQQVRGIQALLPSRATIAVPAQISPVELDQYKRVFKMANVQVQHAVAKPQSVVKAIGGSGQTALGLIDIGSQTIEVGLFVGQEPVAMTTIRGLGGDEYTARVQEFVKSHYRCYIGWQTAEKMKQDIGSVWLTEKAAPIMVVRGRDVNSDMMMTIKVSATDLEPLFQHLVQEMEVELKLFFTQQPPDVVTHAIEQGIYLTGGGSLLRGMTQLLSDHLQTDVIHSSHPTMDVINGFKKTR